MDLWTLTQERQSLDPDELAVAIGLQAAEPEPDYRTRLLIRDAALSLLSFWGPKRFSDWLEGVSSRSQIGACLEETFPEVGFPSLPKRICVSTRPETIKRYLRELGEQLTTPVRVVIGGSSALILAGLLSRHTEDIDLVDEVPESIRGMRASLKQLQAKHRLHLAHFQSHYLPSGWEDRTHSQGKMGQLDVHSVDPLDILTGKLLSKREKDQGDLLELTPRAFSREQLASRLEACRAHLSDPELRASAEHNWNVLFGETLPV
ncbi:MAG: hypothetical protein AMXMBFR33_20490 [Candidatus Xenobia bacterium]